MNFEQTHMPDQPVFRDAFAAGWAKYQVLFSSSGELASAQYLRGPVAMARLIAEHGGEGHEIAAAACLAGPAVFCETPMVSMNKALLDFSRVVRAVDIEKPGDLRRLPSMNENLRLFLQASAIMLLEQIADPVTGQRYRGGERNKTYDEALQLYSAARGGNDDFRLDTRFEIAAMKVTSVLDDQSHLWSRARRPAMTVVSDRLN